MSTEKSSDVDVETTTSSVDVVKEKTLDDFIRLGAYCCRILLFAEFCLLAGAGNMVYMMYAGATPRNIRCFDGVSMIDDVCSSTVDTSNCTFMADYEFLSVNVEFGHLCSSALVKSSISVQMAGVMAGTLVAGTLSDRLGRLKVLSVAFVMVSLFSIACSFATNLLSFTILRSLLGFFNAGLVGTYGVYKVEHVPRRHRFLVATIVSWAPNFMILSVVAWWAHDWRTFQRAIAFLSAPAMIVYFFVNESPRWLIQKGRIAEARRVLRQMHVVDGANDDDGEELEKMLDREHKKQEEQERKRKHYDVRHLFATNEMALVTVIMLFGKFSTSLTNYGLMFNIERLSGSIYVNSLLMAAIRWASNIAVGAMDFKCKMIGRKIVHFVAQFLISTCLLLIAVIYFAGISTDLASLVRISTLIAVAVAAQIFITKSIVTVEFYPTAVRNSAIAIESMASRVGTILAPQLFISTTYLALPYLLLSVLSYLDTLSFQIYLPETKGRSLPDTIPEKKTRKEAAETPFLESELLKSGEKP